jgi:tRNA nucleotidyltransferase (CCA-adding enzyme)
VRRWISLYVTRLRDEKSWIDGEDLKKIGIPPGPEYKEILRRVLLARLDGKATTREEEIAFVRRRYRSLIA